MAGTTRGYVLRSFDEPAGLAGIGVPELESSQVLVEVRASSINAFDWKVATGVLRHVMDYDFPVTIGRDYAGVVVDVGDRVERVALGDAVFGFLGGQRLHRGAFAEQLWVDESECFVAKPDELTFATAACLPLSGTVALRCVDAVVPEPGAQRGRAIVVVGAPGGVGTIAVQLLAGAGLDVVATGRPDDEDYLRDLGAGDVVEPGDGLAARIRDLHPDGVAGWIDLVHYRPQLIELLDLVARGGKVASVHRAVDPADLEARDLVGSNIMSAPDPSLLERLAKLAAADEIRIPLQQTCPLDRVSTAISHASASHTRGKSVIVMGVSENEF